MNDNYIIQNNISNAFTCSSCGKKVQALEYGGRHRNHCPHCLCSLHLDIKPGDRRSNCRGVMKPIGIHVQTNGEWSVIHQCTRCGTVKINRIAYDDNELLLLSIAAEPLMSMPFPSKDILNTLRTLSMDKGVKNEHTH